jgi:hypothetical protein
MPKSSHSVARTSICRGLPTAASWVQSVDKYDAIERAGLADNAIRKSQGLDRLSVGVLARRIAMLVSGAEGSRGRVHIDEIFHDSASSPPAAYDGLLIVLGGNIVQAGHLAIDRVCADAMACQ